MHRQKILHAKSVNLDGGKLQVGLAKLVLTLVEVLRQVLEKEALRRVESGTLTVEEVDRLGLAFMQIKQKVYELSQEFGVNYEELDVNLGLLHAGNKSLASVSLVDVIDKLLYKKVAIAGKVKISVADIDLVILDLLAVISRATALRHSNSAKVVRNIDRR